MESNRHVLVTTEYRGVFFGKLVEDKSPIVVLEGMRNCVSWPAEVHGVFGLAANGPTSGCRIGPKVPSATLRKVTALVDCTPEAVEAWEKEPWN